MNKLWLLIVTVIGHYKVIKLTFEKQSRSEPIIKFCTTTKSEAINNFFWNFSQVFKRPVTQQNVLFISFKFVKGFLAISFYYLLFLAECQRFFYITRNEISAYQHFKSYHNPHNPQGNKKTIWWPPFFALSLYSEYL